jgi:hypothetical protein
MTIGIERRKLSGRPRPKVCISSRLLDGYDLLHNDKDFDPFVKHLGLHVVT